MENLIQALAIYALPVILAITLHEAAHGYVARHFGDSTAWVQGRVSLNPLRHIDPIGTILVPALLLALSSGGVLFGWAKPVPVNFGALRRPKQDMLWVAAAGPGANLVMAFFWSGLLKFATLVNFGAYQEPLMRMCFAGIAINAALMLLNLLPIPPLDGGRIAVSLLPDSLAWKFARIEPFGFLILLVLLFTHMLDLVLLPAINGFILMLQLLFNF